MVKMQSEVVTISVGVWGKFIERGFAGAVESKIKHMAGYGSWAPTCMSRQQIAFHRASLLGGTPRPSSCLPRCREREGATYPFVTTAGIKSR